MVHLLCFPKYYRGSSETETYFQGGKLKSAVLKGSFEMHFKNGNMAIHREDFWLVTMKWLKLRLLPGILLCKTLPHWAPLSSSDLPFAAWRLDSSSNSAWCLFLTSPLKTDGWEREPLLTIAVVSSESNRWLLTQRSQTQRFWAPVFLPVVQALFCFHPSTLYLLE